MALEEAVKTTKDGTLIDLEVTPGAKGTAVPSGYNPWRKRIEAKLCAPPEKGRANEELIAALAGLFGVASSDVEIVAGATSSRKTVLVRGIGREQAIAALRGGGDGRL